MADHASVDSANKANKSVSFDQARCEKVQALYHDKIIEAFARRTNKVNPTKFDNKRDDGTPISTSKEFEKRSDSETNRLLQKFCATLPQYCKQALPKLSVRKEFEAEPEAEFYEQYVSDTYSYSDQAVNETKKKFTTSGGCAIVSGWNILTAYGLYHTIGRPEGNFVTSLDEDLNYCMKDGGKKFRESLNDDKAQIAAEKSKTSYNPNKSFSVNTKNDVDAKDGSDVAQVKGMSDLSNYNSGMYMYYYTPEFIENVNEEAGLNVAQGSMAGAFNINLPGMMTWAGDVNEAGNEAKSESELIVPHIKLDEPYITTTEDAIKTIDRFNSVVTIPTQDHCYIHDKKINVTKGDVFVKPIQPMESSSIISTAKEWTTYNGDKAKKAQEDEAKK